MSNRLTDNYRYSSGPEQNRALLVTLLLFCFVPVIALAQVLYGSITCTVTDSTGALITGARITVLEVQTGITTQALTDSSGIYRFTTLLPGTYRVTVSVPSFATQQTPGVIVSVNELARVDAQLKVGSTTQDSVIRFTSTAISCITPKREPCCSLT